MYVSGLFSLCGALLKLITGGKPGLVIGRVTSLCLNAPSSAPLRCKQTVIRHELPGGTVC